MEDMEQAYRYRFNLPPEQETLLACDDTLSGIQRQRGFEAWVSTGKKVD